MNPLVVEAFKHSSTGLQRSIHRVLTDLQAARVDGTYRRGFQRLASVDVLALMTSACDRSRQKWRRIRTT
jgi:hypothetical protein